MASVVTITITTMAEKVSAPKTGSPATNSDEPIPAKIKPTSPRGIIPTPTARRLIPFSRTPNEQTCFPMIAATLRPAANVRTLTSANERRSTLSPISTKNTGTRIELMGETISSNLSLLIWE